MPNDTGSNMELRALLAVVLSMVAITAYQYFFVPPPPTPQELAAESVVEPPPPEESVARDEEVAGTAAAGATGTGVEPPEEEEGRSLGTPVGSDDQRTLTVHSSLYNATLTNVGGRIESFVLRDYVDDFGRSLDLVHPGARARDELMLGLASPERPEVAAVANQALYEIRVDGRPESGSEIDVGAEAVSVELVWADGSGWEVTKRLEFLPLSYQVEVGIQARSPEGDRFFVTLGPGLNPVSTDSRNVYLRQGPVIFRPDEGLEHWDADDLDGPVTLTGAFRWAGIESHYFLGAWLLEREAELRMRRFTVAAPGPAQSAEGSEAAQQEGATEPEEPATIDLVQLLVDVPAVGLAAPVFFGPKRYQQLTEEGHQLHEVVDFGFFGIIARPLLYGLNWIQSWVLNYGVAIMLLTLVLWLVFLPLNHKAMVSMRKTQSLQPQMKAIRAKYKNVKDLEKRQKMNEEIMELYRREGVSPFGGCLPMLFQLPILFAFYSLLSVAIELRDASFILWIHDLSNYDPYFVLPLLMGSAQFAAQRMTPMSSANPTQARMMGLMPVIFTVLFLYVPSGLVLYWTTNNVLRIGQQVYVNRVVEQESQAQPRGGGKGKKGQRGKK